SKGESMKIKTIIVLFLGLTISTLWGQERPNFKTESADFDSITPIITESGFIWKVKLKSNISPNDNLNIEFSELRNIDQFILITENISNSNGYIEFTAKYKSNEHLDWIFENGSASLFFKITLNSQSKKNPNILNIPLSIDKKSVLDLRILAIQNLKLNLPVKEINYYINLDGRRWDLLNHSNNNNQIFYEFYPFPGIPEYSPEIFQIFRYKYTENEKFNLGLKDKNQFYKLAISDLKKCKSFTTKKIKEDSNNIYFSYSFDSCNGGKSASYIARYSVGQNSSVYFVFTYLDKNIPPHYDKIYLTVLENQPANY
ncbi:hypothetical protein, partial [Leptospira kanakyensis]|uniref:hypothetical protein n=1 Tax=Leptospira kanakyensis TaxID=2484968 RepID=UPI00223CF358